VSSGPWFHPPLCKLKKKGVLYVSVLSDRTMPSAKVVISFVIFS
jgi:hypothetical protein